MKSAYEFDFQTLSLYISVWGWQIIAIILFLFSIVLFALPRTLFTLVWAIAAFFNFVFCEIMVLKRRREFYEYETC